MTPTDRYLKRIRFWLPARGRDDILEELRNLLDERLQDGETQRGRKLSEAEADEIVARFGDPTVVAGRYAQQRPVISAGLAHFFWRVLGVALGAAILAQLIVFAVQAAHAPALLPLVGQALTRAAIALLLGFFFVTATFIILDRQCGKAPPL